MIISVATSMLSEVITDSKDESPLLCAVPRHPENGTSYSDLRKHASC